MNPTLKKILLNSPMFVTRGLLEYWDFVQGADPQVLYGAYGLNGQLGSTAEADENDPAWLSRGCRFITEDYITLPDTALVSGNNDLTIIVVAKTDVAETRGLFSYGLETGGTTPVMAQYSTDSFLFSNWTVDIYVPFIPGSAPFMATYRYTASLNLLEGFINGTSVRGANIAPSNFVASNGKIGYVKYSNYWKGDIYATAIYNASLTDSEVNKLYKYFKSSLIKNGVILL